MDSSLLDDSDYGQALFSTTVDVTGALSETAARAAAHKLVCLLVLSRLSTENMADAYECLTDVYNRQLAQAHVQGLQLPGPDYVVVNNGMVTHTTMKPFSIEED